MLDILEICAKVAFSALDFAWEHKWEAVKVAVLYSMGQLCWTIACELQRIFPLALDDVIDAQERQRALHQLIPCLCRAITSLVYIRTGGRLLPLNFP